MRAEHALPVHLEAGTLVQPPKLQMSWLKMRMNEMMLTVVIVVVSRELMEMKMLMMLTMMMLMMVADLEIRSDQLAHQNQSPKRSPFLSNSHQNAQNGWMPLIHFGLPLVHSGELSEKHHFVSQNQSCQVQNLHLGCSTPKQHDPQENSKTHYQAHLYLHQRPNRFRWRWFASFQVRSSCPARNFRVVVLGEQKLNAAKALAAEANCSLEKKVGHASPRWTLAMQAPATTS